MQATRAVGLANRFIGFGQDRIHLDATPQPSYPAATVMLIR